MRPTAPRAASVRYLGDDLGNALLQSLGLVFTRDITWTPAGASLYLLGNGAAVARGDLTNFVTAGGRVFILPGTNASPGLLGETRVLRTNCVGSLSAPAWPEAAGLSASDLRARAPFTNWVLSAGVSVSADDLLARVSIGSGVVILSQLDRAALRAESFPYLRFTRWRQTRATAQLLANLGASFVSDSWILQPGAAGAGDQSVPPPATPPVGFSGYFYYPDYQRDFATGDDPYRYYNW